MKLRFMLVALSVLPLLFGCNAEKRALKSLNRKIERIDKKFPGLIESQRDTLVMRDTLFVPIPSDSVEVVIIPGDTVEVEKLRIETRVIPGTDSIKIKTIIKPDTVEFVRIDTVQTTIYRTIQKPVETPEGWWSRNLPLIFVVLLILSILLGKLNK